MKKQRLSSIITVIGCLLILLISACSEAPDDDSDNYDTDDDGYNTEVSYYGSSLELALVNALGKTEGEKITADDLATLTHLELSYFERFDVHLLPFGRETDGIALLARCINLRVLDLTANRITDISPLAGLTHLTELNLSENPLVDADLSPLAGLPRLTKLNLSSTGISDLEPLAGLVNLQWLDLSDSRIFVGGKIRDITPLAGMVQLKELDLENNQIRDITPLTNLIQINKLYLQRNMIVDLKPLVDNPGLVNKNIVPPEGGFDWGVVVGVHGNPLNNVSINVYIPALQARGVIVR